MQKSNKTDNVVIKHSQLQKEMFKKFGGCQTVSQNSENKYDDSIAKTSNLFDEIVLKNLEEA